MKEKGKKGMGSFSFAIMIFLIAVLGAFAGWVFLGNGYELLTDYFQSYIYIDGTAYDKNITEIVLSGSDISDYSQLNEFKYLKKVDIRGQQVSCDEYEAISSVLNGKEIKWRVPIGSYNFDNDTSEIKLSEDMPAEQLERIKYLTTLKSINTNGYALCDELYDAVKFTFVSDSDCDLICNTEVYGVELNSQTETLILNNKKINDTSELENAFKFFPKLKSIEMCGCGLSNETMAGLRDKYPEIKFVWTVSFLDFTVRTDILVFSTLVYDLPVYGNSKTFSPLFKYCTELRALDLGHYQINDISEITNLKKLEVLILADNCVTDLTPLAELQELHYVELFFNRISDLTPLTKLEKLEDLNICYNRRIKNPLELLNCKNLKRLYVSNCGFKTSVINELKAGLPKDCEFNYWCENAVNDGWRSNAKNKAIRRAFYRWRKVTAYEDWEHVTYKE